MDKYLKPHELARQLNQAEYEIVDGRVESRRLGDILKRLDRVSAGVYGKRYDENEYGYASVGVMERGLARDGASFVVGATVTFHDPQGNETRLGDIQYVDEARTIATVSLQTGENQTDPLLPDHAAWDAVVGTVTRAVDQAWTERFGQQA